MIKFEIDEHSSSALLHMGNALVNIANDLLDPKEKKPAKELYKGDKLYGANEAEQASAQAETNTAQVETFAAQAETNTAQVETFAAQAETTTQEQTSAVELDTNKHPWDDRIHTGKRTKNADGTWKIVRIPKAYKANPEGWDQFVQKVLNELNNVEVQLPTETENPDPNAEFSPPADAKVSTDASTPNNFDEFIQFSTTNNIARDTVNSACLKFGVPSILALGETDYALKIPLVYAELKASL